MKVLEIKNNLVKIAYDVVDNLALGGFVIIEDENNPYVAQVMNIKADSMQNFAIVKLLFTFNDEGVLKSYNGTIPSLKANVTILPTSELLDVIPVETPLVLGKLAQQTIPVKVDKDILESNLLICSDNVENTFSFMDCIIKQIEDKIVIFDFDDSYESKVFLGRNFKLPLNYDAINFIYENELEDLDVISKAVIQDIFLEVQEYTKTLPEKFIPFSSFLNVIEQQYKETQIPELVLLKNKLLKYKEMNIFAETLKDVLNLNIILESPELTVFDISEFLPVLQKYVISYIYSVMNKADNVIYSFIKVDNSNSNKKLLKTYLKREGVFTSIIASHEYKYLREVKEYSSNIIFFTPLTLTHDFGAYNSFLSKLNSDEFVLYGSHTQNIPLILETIDYDADFNSYNESNQSVVSEVTTEEIPVQEIIDENLENEILDNEDELSSEILDEQEPMLDIPNDSDEDEIVNILADDDIEIQETILPEFDDEVVDEDANEVDVVPDSETIDLPTETFIDSEENIVSVEYAQNLADDELVEQVAKDVDKVFYEKLPSVDDDFEEYLPVEDSFDEELTDDDLNLIDDLSETEFGGENTDLGEDSEFDELVPIVPIYEAEHENTVIEFEPGDKVFSPKFGEGIVERMIQYGNKNLCSINFPEIGRRTLDPTITELEKLS